MSIKGGVPTDLYVKRGAGKPISETISLLGTFGDYEIIEEIALGGTEVVYKARHTKLNRLVALKMIRSGELAEDEEAKRFYTEAKAAAGLDHPNIVPIYEAGQQRGQHYFSMGFVEGQSLQDDLQDGPLEPCSAATVTS